MKTAAKHWIRGVPLFYFHSSCDICHTEKCKTNKKIIGPTSQDPDLTDVNILPKYSSNNFLKEMYNIYRTAQFKPQSFPSTLFLHSKILNVSINNFNGILCNFFLNSEKFHIIN